MKYSRLIVLSVALGAGLLAARMVMTSDKPEPQPIVMQEPVEAETSEILVAAKDITLGNKLTASDIAWADWPKSAVPNGAITKEQSPKALQTYVGQIAKAQIYDGEPIRSQRLISTDQGFMAALLPKGKRAIAVSVEAETTAGGFILPGDKVDVLLTKTQRGTNSATTQTILENVRVLAIDTVTAGEKEQKTLSPKRTATLELMPAETEVIAEAQQVGTISLALRSAQDSADDEAPTVRRRGGVNFVKYGVTTQAATQ